MVDGKWVMKRPLTGQNGDNWEPLATHAIKSSKFMMNMYKAKKPLEAMLGLFKSFE